MFHRLSFFLIIIIILSSCKTINEPELGSGPIGTELEQIYPETIKTKKIETTETPEPPEPAGPKDILIWCEPSKSDITLFETIPSPPVNYSIVMMGANNEKEAGSEDAPPETFPKSELPDVHKESPAGSEPSIAAASEENTSKEDEAAEKNETYVEKQIEPAVVSEKKVTQQKVTERSLSAPVQEVFLTEADGLGWILEGYTDENGKKTNHLKYSGREYIGEKTVFSFFAYKAGVYNIQIIKNDYADGSMERQILRVEVVDASRKPVEADPAPVVKQNEGQPVILPEMRTEAAEVETENIISKAEILGDNFTGKDLREASERLAAAGDCAGAAELIRYGIEKLLWDELDYFYFTLAYLYENCAEIRDERIAAEYYKKIVDSYPISNYWVSAKDKLIYLERNFIHIR